MRILRIRIPNTALEYLSLPSSVSVIKISYFVKALFVPVDFDQENDACSVFCKETVIWPIERHRLVNGISSWYPTLLDID
jgi:hypothetical protein